MSNKFPILTRIVASATLLAAGPVAAAPPIWMVEDADSTVYMMGTIHLMREDGAWRTKAFEEAFAQADEVWLEILGAGNAAELGPLVLRHGMSPDEPLSEILPDEDLALLEAALEPYGIPLESMDGMRPWFAAIQLATLPLLEAGFDPAMSLDLMIEGEAQEAGKRLQAFETAEEQISMLAGLSEDEQIEMLRQTLIEFEAAGDTLVTQVEAWIDGDLAALEEAIAEAYAVAPEFHEALFIERNIAFVDDIEEILTGKGTTLIAVGLGHFVGEGSIPDVLEERGFTVEVLD
ncbi:TraB/GumN family protein [Pelagibacterium halotolerans]|uniref:TraB/GumN family protein n=1 Tax=Pelagibacterium halotolerans TaxID=531813 RepID=UPI00384CE0D0